MWRRGGDDVHQLRDAGWLVLPAVVPAELVLELAEAVWPAVEDVLASIGGIVGLERQAVGPLRLGADLTLAPPYGQPQLVTHPAVLALVRAVLGPLCELSLFGFDCSFPGAGHQVVHRDFAGLPRPAGAPGAGPERIVVNFPLCPFDLITGATELWPATHALPDEPFAGAGAGAAPPDGDPAHRSLGQRAAALPSVHLHARPGDAVIRNPWAWHRGTPNRSARPRPMIAVGYSAPWVRYPPLRVPDALWEALTPADRPLLAASRRLTGTDADHPAPEPVLRLEPPWTDADEAPAR